MAVSESELTTELAGLDALEADTSVKAPLAKRAWSRLWPKVAAIAIVIAIWQAVVWSHWRPEFVFPGPKTVGSSLFHLVRTHDFWQATLRTTQRAIGNYVAALIVGSVIGAMVAAVKPLRTAVGALITGLQTMPSIVWFPLAVLLFKLGESAISFVVIMGAAPAIANGLIDGIDHVPPLLVRAGRVLGAKNVTLFRHVILPAALPAFLGGLKQAWAFAWRSLMAAELLVPLGKSLGGQLEVFRNQNDSPGLFAMMIVLLVFGLLVDSLFGAADNALRRRRGLIDTATAAK